MTYRMYNKAHTRARSARMSAKVEPHHIWKDRHDTMCSSVAMVDSSLSDVALVLSLWNEVRRPSLLQNVTWSARDYSGLAIARIGLQES
jgi:hypothetical protein